MANPFVKAWKYLMALFSSKVDEYADPKVQIQQAIEEAQRQHQRAEHFCFSSPQSTRWRMSQAPRLHFIGLQASFGAPTSPAHTPTTAIG